MCDYYANRNNRWVKPDQTTYMLFYATVRYLKEKHGETSKKDVYEFLTGYPEANWSHDYWAAMSKDNIISYERKGKKSLLNFSDKNPLENWLKSTGMTYFDFITTFKNPPSGLKKKLNVILWSKLK
jgi:hypothetical protein